MSLRDGVPLGHRTRFTVPNLKWHLELQPCALRSAHQPEPNPLDLTYFETSRRFRRCSGSLQLFTNPLPVCAAPEELAAAAARKVIIQPPIRLRWNTLP